MILVRYADGSFGKVPEEVLSRLLSQGKITHFRRGEGWVQVGSHPTRQRPTLLRGKEERRGRGDASLRSA